MDLSDIFEPMEATGKIDVGVEEQDVPDDGSCPECGAEIDDEQVVEHRLSTMGYLHDDVAMECDECGATWPYGVPVGDHEPEHDLRCPSCGHDYMRVHRVAPRWEDDVRVVMLHLKCPECYYFEKQQREVGPHGKSLVGYPDITGSTDGAEPEGYTE
jgi:uncharacterized Zn finger protein